MPTTYAIPNGSTAFAATLYTGNATTNSINIANNGVGFQPDFSWFKVRSETGNHIVHDVLRGAGGVNRLFPNTTSAESTNGDGFVTFTSTGFDLNGGGSGGDVNAMTGGVGRTYVAWSWKANGAPVTNTAGSITSQVSANTAAGFSVVTYTGTGANATVGHGLGVAPSMVIVKARTGGVESWYVWQSGLTGGTYWLLLNATNAQANDSTRFTATPTSTVINLGSNSATNGSGYTYVAYCWAAVPGYSAFGSYVANASADGPFMYTGFRPRWIMLKRTSAAGAPWTMIDTSRNPYNSAAAELDANTSSAESTSGSGMDILSNGFKLRDSVYFNSSSGDTFIYAAFAENPFKYANAR